MNDDVQAVLRGTSRWCVVEGDALDGLALLRDGSVDAFVTDLPYASVVGSASGVVTRGQVTQECAPDNQFWRAWFREHMREMGRAAKPTGAFWSTIDWRGIAAIDQIAAGCGFRAPSLGVWSRGGMGLGYVLRHAIETWCVCVRPKFKRLHTDEVDLWDVPWSAGSSGESEHRAEKPIPLMARAIRLVTEPDAIVCDPFAGSGTTGVAALREGRRVILFERVAAHAETARQRCAAVVAGTDWRRPEQPALPGVAKVSHG